MKKSLSVLLVLAVLAISYGSVSAATTVPGGPFASAIMVQNLGTAEASVTIQYVTAGGVVAFTSNHTIAVEDVLTVIVANESLLASGEYSVVVSSSQPVAAVSNWSDSNSGASYSGASAGAQTWYVPGVYDNFYGFYSEVYAQNVSAAAQNVTLEVFAPGSSIPVYTNTKNAVPANASVNWGLSGLTQLVNNVAYSAKISAVADVVVMASTWGSNATAPQLYSFNGFSSGSTTFYTPVVLNNYYGWNASIAVQNVGAASANVDVLFSNGTLVEYTIAQDSAVSIFIPGVAGLPSGSAGLFGATITSDVPVAVMVNQSNVYNRAATYSGVPSGTTKVYAPNVMKRYYTYSSSVTCQNLGAASAVMSIDFAGVPAAAMTSASIAAGASWSVYLPGNANIPNGHIGSAIVTANQPIACVINSNAEDAPYNTQNMDAFYSYNGVNQ